MVTARDIILAARQLVDDALPHCDMNSSYKTGTPPSRMASCHTNWQYAYHDIVWHKTQLHERKLAELIWHDTYVECNMPKTMGEFVPDFPYKSRYEYADPQSIKNLIGFIKAIELASAGHSDP